MLAADAAEGSGLALPELKSSTQSRMTRRAAHPAGATNPVDLGADVSPATLTEALRALIESGAVDALVVNLVATATNDIDGLQRAAANAPSDAPTLPVAVVVVGKAAPRQLGRHRVPVYDLPEDAVRAVGHAYHYHQWRAEPEGVRPDMHGVDVLRARRIIGEVLISTPGWQPNEVAVELLGCYGVLVVETRVAASAEEAVRAARACRLPGRGEVG